MFVRSGLILSHYSLIHTLCGKEGVLTGFNPTLPARIWRPARIPDLPLRSLL